MSVKSNIHEMYGMIGLGQAMEAFEKYYGENVVMIEASGDRFEGKDANRQREMEFFGSIQEMHGGGTNAITTDEENGYSMVEAWMDVTFKNGGRVKMEQVARQKWENDQIVEERFYYNMPG